MKLSVSLCAALLLPIASAAAQEAVSFRKDVAPILVNSCLACHGPKKAEGGYRVDTFELAVKEGDSAAPGFVAKDLDGSEAYRRMISADQDERMPKDGDPLPAEQLALVKRWLEEGAAFDAPDAKAPLISIIPPPTYPDPPAAYAHPLPVTALAFSPDGTQLFAGGYHEITVWNPADGALLRRIKNVGQRTYALQFSPDGKFLAAAGGTAGRLGEVRLYDPATGDLIKVLGAASDVIFDLAFDAAGQLAAGGADGVIRLYDANAGTEIKVIESHSDWIMALAFNADGSRLASGSRDKTAKVFDAKTGELQVTYSEHNAPVRGVAFHPNGTQVYSSGEDARLRVWNLADGKRAAEIPGFGNEVYKLTTGGDFLFAPSNDKTVKQFELATQKPVRPYGGHGDWALTAAFHPATARLATGGFDGEVRIWNAADGAQVATFFALPGYVKK